MPRMKQLHVAWDNCFARRNQTGTGVYAARLLERLSKSEDIRIEVFGGWPDSSSPQARLGRALRFGGSLAWVHGRLPFLLRAQSFDLLHSPAFIAPVKSPCPKVVTVHDITHLLYPSHFASWWIRYLSLAMPRVLRSSSAIICGSEHSKRDIVNAYGLPSKNVHVVPYGVDHSRFCPDAVLDEEWARSFGLRAGYVLHVGEFSQRKNIPVLLRAVDHLRSKGKWEGRQLVLAGTASPGVLGAAEIQDVLRELDLGDSVIATGRVPDSHLPGLYRHAGVLVMPSLYEGFGFPVLESMAVGTPVVASNVSSLPEVAGDAAILISPQDVAAFANAIDDVLSNKVTADELRRKGYCRAREYSWERAAEETVAVYRSVASE
jgi:glycosyltransferase involved in cell wall biosynthesis